MTVTTSTSAGISQRTNVYAAREMLKHAMPELVLDRTAKPVRMPKNKSRTIKFRRPVPFTAADTPLQEGVTPTASAFAYEDVSATLNQYGDLVIVTDVIEDTHEDPVLNDAAVQCGENIGRTIEKLNYGVVRAGTSVIYSNGSDRSSVNTPISLSKLRAAVRALRGQKAKWITKVQGGSTDFATTPISRAFVAMSHSNLESDIRNLPGFVPCEKYGSKNLISEYEIGAVESVRFVLSADLPAFEDEGAATSTMISTSGSNADVYPLIVFGQEAWASVNIRDKNTVSPHIVPVNEVSKSDPLAQRGYVGWKTWHAATILNQAWMTRIECAATDL